MYYVNIKKLKLCIFKYLEIKVSTYKKCADAYKK